jgi:elongator complex protein 3
MREIPPEYLVSGTTRIDLRKDIEADLRKDETKIKEIRYREIGFANSPNENLKLKITKYSASDGKEFFLEIVNDDDILFGLLRLRIVDEFARLSRPPAQDALRASGKNNSFSQIQKNKNAIIREIHVYGQSLKLGEKGKTSQHIGLGKWLMNEAEKISVKEKVKKISVISGVGVREYYQKLGYKLENTYMVKFIN